MRTLTITLLAGILLLGTGCTVLEGQRISLHYDKAADRLQVLLNYDGVFNARPKDQAKAEKDLRELAKEGNLMFLDWFAQLRWKELRRAANADGTPQAIARFLQALCDSTEVTTLGQYRDMKGHLGAAQLVTVENAGRIVELANAALSEGVRLGEGDDGWKRTMAAMREAAGAGHTWFTLRGHGLEFETPVHPAEWRLAKLEFFRELMKDAARAAGRDEKHDPAEIAPDGIAWLLSQAPISLDQDRRRLRVRFGFRDGPSTMRVPLRKGHTDNLEAVVKAVAPTDLDARLADHVLGQKSGDVALEAIATWGPPEESVRAVARVAREKDGADRGRALAWLEAWAKRWNEAGERPKAPEKMTHEAWTAWYVKLVGKIE